MQYLLKLFCTVTLLSILFTSCTRNGNDTKMNLITHKQETILAGSNTIVDSMPDQANLYAVVFEDDGTTGYFYALNMQYEMPIQDAFHIYNVKDIKDGESAMEITIAWTQDGNRSVLYINDYPHAVVDFKNKTGYCRTGFPPMDGTWDWSKNGHDWDEEDYQDMLSN